jgi:hypothetical protein
LEADAQRKQQTIDQLAGQLQHLRQQHVQQQQTIGRLEVELRQNEEQREQDVGRLLQSIQRHEQRIGAQGEEIQRLHQALDQLLEEREVEIVQEEQPQADIVQEQQLQVDMNGVPGPEVRSPPSPRKSLIFAPTFDV